MPIFIQKFFNFTVKFLEEFTKINNTNAANDSIENIDRVQSNNDSENETSLFKDCVQTKNTDVYLVKPICFWKVEGYRG